MAVVLFDIIVIVLLFVILNTQSEVNILAEFAFVAFGFGSFVMDTSGACCCMTK
jgi:hypothetical protein